MILISVFGLRFGFIYGIRLCCRIDDVLDSRQLLLAHLVRHLHKTALHLSFIEIVMALL